MCLGILNFTKKYSNKALEECCKQAIALNKQKYTFIKNTISVVADDLGEAGYHHSTSTKKEAVRGGYVMPPEASSIDTLYLAAEPLLIRCARRWMTDAYRNRSHERACR